MQTTALWAPATERSGNCNRISEKILLLEELLEISSPLGEEEDDDGHGGGREQPHGDEYDSDDDDGFDNFEEIKQATSEISAAETCARLERAAQNLVHLELEFYEGVDIPTIQVRTYLTRTDTPSHSVSIALMHILTFSLQREEKRLGVIEETLLRRLETEFATEIFPDTFYNRDHAISASTLSYLLRSYVLLQKSHIPEEMIGRLLVLPFAEENVTRGKLDGRVRGSCEGLQQIYDSILEFISNKFKGILALPICSGESKSSVDILGNAIWKPLFGTLATKHGIIFQAADPDRFHQSYTQSMRFLSSMEESFCVNETMRMRFRSHESVVEFKEKWNMDVYFQLRFSQLSASLEKAFGAKREEQVPDFTLNGPRFLFENSSVLWKTMHDCWAENVFLQPLVPSFSKLCLQLFVFYINIWKTPLVDAVAQLKNGSKIDFSAVPLYFVGNEEDLICAGSDFHVLHEKVRLYMRLEDGAIVSTRTCVCAFCCAFHQ